LLESSGKRSDNDLSMELDSDRLDGVSGGDTEGLGEESSYI